MSIIYSKQENPPPEFYMHEDEVLVFPRRHKSQQRPDNTTYTTSCTVSMRQRNLLEFTPWLQAFGGKTEVSLSYLSLETIRGRSHRMMWLMYGPGYCCIFVGGKNNPSPLGFIWPSGAHVSIWLWLTVFTTAVGGEMTSTVCILSNFTF